MFGARKSIVLSCIAVLLVCGGATAFAVSKTRSTKGTYKTALPSPFVSNADSGAMREVAEDRREEHGDTASAKEVTAINATRGHYKTAAELDAEDRYIDRVAGAENHDPKGTLAPRPGTRGDGGIPIPVGGIAVERTERGGTEVAAADGQRAGDQQGQQADAGQQQQQIPYADDFNDYGAYGPYGLYGGFPANTVNGATANTNNTQQTGNGVVQAQPPQQATSPGGAAIGGPAPGAVGVQGSNVQAPVQNQPVPYQPAPPVQPVPFQTVPPPAAQRGF